MTKPQKTKTPGWQAEGFSKTKTSPSIFTDLHEAIKSALMAGNTVRPIDFSSDQRPYVIGVIATLREKLPIRCGWQTVRESFLSETRLRARRYSIDGAYLNREDDHV